MQDFIETDIRRSLQNMVPNLDALRGKTILITGGTGFVGAWVARSLAWLNDKFDFKCRIILLARNPDKLEKNDPELYQRADITFIRSDVRSIHNLPNDVNFIIHAAASPDNRIHMSDPVNTMDVIAIGTKAVMDAATRLSDIEGIVHLSSGQVYGKPPVNGDTLIETMLGGFFKSDITSIYPEAKRYSETVCLAYRSLYKLPISIVRPFSFIGPFQELNKPWAINSFLQEALNNQPIRIVGNGKPQRSYLYATDMAAWLLMALANGKRGDVYNLGSSEAVSLLDVANKINAIISKPVEIIVQNHNNDISKFVPNLDHITKQLKIQELFSFEKALQHTVKWNVQNLNMDKKEK